MDECDLRLPAADQAGTSQDDFMWTSPDPILVRCCTAKYNAVMTSMSASEARAALPELLTRVEEGEEVTITRHGRPVAILVRPDTLRSRRAEAAFDDARRVQDLLAEAAAAPLPQDGGLTEDRAEELIAEIRAGRDRLNP
jgi:prevent-host-death family protein